MQLAWQEEDLIAQLAHRLKAQPGQLMERVKQVIEEKGELEEKLADLKKGQMSQLADQALDRKEMVNGIAVYTGQWGFPGADLKVLADMAMGRISSGVLAVGTVDQEKCHLIIRVTEDLVKKGINGNLLIKAVAPLIEGSGGGKPENAQAGGKGIGKLPEAFNKIKESIAGTSIK